MSRECFSERLGQELLRAIPEVLGLVSSQSWSVLPEAAVPIRVVYSTTFEVKSPLQGQFSIGVDLQSAKTLAEMLLGTETNNPELADEDKDANGECARQIVGVATERIRAVFADLAIEPIPQPSRELDDAARVLTLSNGTAQVRFCLSVESTLQELVGDSAPDENSGADAVETEKTVSRTRSGTEPNLPLLRGVNLAVKLRFGRRELLLKDVLELSSGSVVELDRDVHEPVELLLDDRVLARGEVVVVDGNYGLRVTEIPLPN